HMTEYIASSAEVGRRPSTSRIFWYSSCLRPSSAYGCSTSGLCAANSTVSFTALSDEEPVEAVVVIVVERPFGRVPGLYQAHRSRSAGTLARPSAGGPASATIAPMATPKIVLFYVFTPLADPEAVRLWQHALAQKNSLTGRVIVSHQ